MRLKSSRQTLTANVALQISAAATLLILPNVLTAEAFSETVYIAMLLSFIAMADMGLSYVHGRVVPGMHSKGESELVAHWDRTVHSFGLITSLVFSAAVSISYFAKFHSLSRSLLLFPIAPMTFLTGFHVSRIASLGDFLTYRRVTVLRALLALGILPLVFLWGVTGWFTGALLSATFLLIYIRKTSWITFYSINLGLVREHIGEGLARCCITVLWMQLLNVGRLYASTHYSHTEIAEYGIANSAYASLSSLLIAVFLPVSVETLRRYSHDKNDAMRYVHEIAERVAPWALLGTIAVTEISPVLFRWLFPTYNLDPIILASILSGVLFYPFFIMWGNCLVGSRHFITYIALILIGLATAWSVAVYFGDDKRGAAIGQFIGLMFFSFAMYGVAPKILDAPVKQWLRSMLVFALTAGTGVVYWGIRWGS